MMFIMVSIVISMRNGIHAKIENDQTQSDLVIVPSAIEQVDKRNQYVVPFLKGCLKAFTSSFLGILYICHVLGVVNWCFQTMLNHERCCILLRLHELAYTKYARKNI